jgi:hypothetical protein
MGTHQKPMSTDNIYTMTIFVQSDPHRDLCTHQMLYNQESRDSPPLIYDIEGVIATITHMPS